jgi:Bifunctional DNA primase/polymerase, N-terminal/Primase C terminal 1 (PriCT-1)
LITPEEFQKTIPGTLTLSVSFRGAAQPLAMWGWRVFPIKPKGKTPLTKNGCLDATTDPEVIEQWAERWPSANVALRTGDLVVIDVDAAHGGNEALAELQAKYAAFPPTLESATGGGGKHYFFDSGGAEIHNSASKLGPGLDVRGLNGYVVLPPSVHQSGNRYTWKSPKGIGPAPLPGWLYQLLESSRPVTTSSNENAPSSDQTIRDGTRNDTLFRKACKLRADGLSAAAILATLLVHNAENCDPPLPESEVRGIAEQAGKCAAGKSAGADPIDPAMIATDENVALPDLPEAALDGSLGDICQTLLRDFPLALAWPALLAAAGALIRSTPNQPRTNLYVALVGPAHCGKSCAIEAANYFLDVRPPMLESLKAGSAEGLLAKIGDQNGNSVLLFPDELSHLLEKAQIAGASFAYALNTAFYHGESTLTIAHGQIVKFNCRLSLIGGVVDEKFDDSFGSATTGGLYDRFLFGQCPSGYSYLWKPLDGPPAITETFDGPRVNADVWEARNGIHQAEKINPRILELAIRCAFICAAIDGREELRAADLAPAWALARYQQRVRILLQPNGGKNFEGRIALKILNHLGSNAADGRYLVLRDVLRATRAYEYGPSTCERALNAMRFGGSIEEIGNTSEKGQKRRLIRLAGDFR